MTPAAEPSQLEMEHATTRLLALAFIEIRYFTETSHEDQSPEALAQRREAANAIADICHNLPGYLAPERRNRLSEGLQQIWKTSPGKQRWIRSRFDEIGYDHRWLTNADL